MSNTLHNVKRKMLIAHWNANGLGGHIREVMNFLDTHEIYILLVKETKLTEKITCKIPGYQCFRKDRPGKTPSGGVAI